jgi:hypothetical protein
MPSAEGRAQEKRHAELSKRCLELHRERPELSNRDLSHTLGMTIGHVRKVIGERPEPPREIYRDPPKVDRGCIHEQAHTLRYMFACTTPYVYSDDGKGYYQQWARRDALDMALADRPIPECDCVTVLPRNP